MSSRHQKAKGTFRSIKNIVVFPLRDKTEQPVHYACKETILAAVDTAFPNTRLQEGSYKAQGGETMSDQGWIRNEILMLGRLHRR